VEIPRLMVSVDGPVMIAASAHIPLSRPQGSRLVRWEAAAMLVCYTLYVVLRAVLS
jgi:hypothetical protein